MSKVTLDATEALASLQKIDGVIGGAIGDLDSGMMLASAGSNFDWEKAIAGNCDVVRTKARVAKSLGFPDQIEEILITLTSQYHLIRVCRNATGLFLYVAADRERSNLATVRRRLQDVDAMLSM